MITEPTRVFYAELHRAIGQPWKRGSELKADDAASLSWERVVGLALARTRTYQASAHRPVSVIEFLARALCEAFVTALPASLPRPTPDEGSADHHDIWLPVATKVLAAAQAVREGAWRTRTTLA